MSRRRRERARARSRCATRGCSWTSTTPGPTLRRRPSRSILVETLDGGVAADLPGVVLRRGLVRRPDLIESRERLVVEVDVEGGDGIVELLKRAGADDRPGDPGTGQQPGESDASRLLADLVAQVLVGLHLFAVLLEKVFGATLRPARARALLLEDSAEQAAVQRTPGDDTESVVLRCRQHLELDLATGEVVERLLADEAHEVALSCCLLRSGEMPAGEVAATDVEDLPLRPQRLHRLPDLVPRRRAVDVVHLVKVDVVGLQPTQGPVATVADVAC